MVWWWVAAWISDRLLCMCQSAGSPMLWSRDQSRWRRQCWWHGRGYWSLCPCHGMTCIMIVRDAALCGVVRQKYWYTGWFIVCVVFVSYSQRSICYTRRRQIEVKKYFTKIFLMCQFCWEHTLKLPAYAAIWLAGAMNVMGRLMNFEIFFGTAAAVWWTDCWIFCWETACARNAMSRLMNLEIFLKLLLLFDEQSDELLVEKIFWNFLLRKYFKTAAAAVSMMSKLIMNLEICWEFEFLELLLLCVEQTDELFVEKIFWNCCYVLCCVTVGRS